MSNEIIQNLEGKKEYVVLPAPFFERTLTRRSKWDPYNNPRDIVMALFVGPRSGRTFACVWVWGRTPSEGNRFETKEITKQTFIEFCDLVKADPPDNVEAVAV